MKIDDFVSLLNDFNQVWVEFPDPQNMTGELPCFEKISPYSRYSKAEFSNNSMDLYLGHMEMGVVHLKLEDGEQEIVGNDRYETIQYINKKLFVDGKPLYKRFNIVCMDNELDNIKNNELCINVTPVGDTWLGAHVVTLDLEKISFDHFKVGSPDYKKIAELALELSKLKANAKVANWFVSEYGLEEKDDKYTKLTAEYSDEALEILKKNRINDFGFSPIPYYSKKITPITIKIGGMSSLPKVDDVIKRIKANKQQTTAGAVMKPIAEKINGLDDSKRADIAIMANEINEHVRLKQLELRDVVYNAIITNDLKTRGEKTFAEIREIDNFTITIEMTK